MNDVIKKKPESLELQRSLELDKLSYQVHLDRLLSAGRSYDSAILSLSTASLGFTFAFIRAYSSCRCNCLLYFTWFFLILSIILILCSFVIDQQNTLRRIGSLSESYKKGTKEKDNNHWTDFLMTLLPYFSGILFVIAIITITIYVGINI